MIRSYNQYMGGVDLTDRFLSQYKPKIRSKKWWWTYFSYLLNTAVVAAWRLHCNLHSGDEKLSQLAFLRKVIVNLLSQVPNRKRSHATAFEEDIRTDGFEHWPAVCPEKKRLRCKFCGKQSVNRCVKCKVALHIECFQQFHCGDVASDAEQEE